MEVGMLRAPWRVHTIILNYREVDDTLRCVSALRKSEYVDQCILVVDNGADDTTQQRLRDGLIGSTILPSPENLGYGGGNNLGIRHALDRPGGFVWLLNPDAEPMPGALAQMIELMRRDPEIGIVAPRILRGGTEPPRIWYDGGVIDWDLGGAASHRNPGVVATDVPATGPRPTDYASGASMLVRRAVFEDIGLLPERYFLYFEETDFNVRARRAGWRIMLEPRATVVHHQRSHGVLPMPYYVYYFVRNRLLFGHAFSDHSMDQLEADVDRWVSAWRKKVADRAPDWVGTFDRLVEWAIEDARAGRDGVRSDIATIPPPGGRG